MENYYQILELSSNASLDEIKKSFRELAKKYHPDRNKDPDSAVRFMKINDAYEALCKEKTSDPTYNFVPLLIVPGKVSVTTPDEYAFVYVSQGSSRFFGTLSESEDKRFCIVFSQGYIDNSDGIGEKWISGKVCFIENENLHWIKDYERLWEGSVSNSGTVAMIGPLKNSSTSSSPSDFIELGCKLVVVNKLGNEIFTHEFDSNSYECVISPDGRHVLVATLRPDNSIYCFDLNYILSEGLKTYRSTLTAHETGFWKYGHHSRNGVHKLRFKNDVIEVFTRDNITSSERDYALNLDGTLLPEYSKELESLIKLKKLRGEAKLQSIFEMINSNERRALIEGLFLLTSFVGNKGSVPYYEKIVRHLLKMIDTADKELLDMLWKIIKGIMKKDASVIDPLVSPLLSTIKKLSNDDELLVYLGALGKFNPAWVIREIPMIKQKLKSDIWNERRLAAFAVGYIGSSNVSLVEDSISQIIEYIANPEKLAKELEQLSKKNNEHSLEHGGIELTIVQIKDPMEDATWIRDACIDTIGEIGKTFPRSVAFAIPLLEEVSRNATSPYTIKKALRAIEAINGKCKETFRHSV